MERKESQSIGDILRLAFQENCMQDRLDEYKAAGLWRTVVGDDFANQCRKPFVSNGIMTIGIPNAALRQEMTMSRTLLRKSLNNLLGKEIITDIRFTS